MTDNLRERGDFAETEQVKCASCGASMTFDPESQSLSCAHCGSVVEIKPDFVERERDFFADMNESEWNEEALTYRCDSCGAVTIMQVGEIAGNCPFCGAGRVVDTESQSGIKPSAIIPFAFGKDSAKEYYKKWIKKKFFAPNKLKKNFVADKVTGIYLPCWTYDAKTYSTYEGRLGEYYYVTVGSGKDRRTVRKTRWYRVYGEFCDNFDDVTVEASAKIDQLQYEKIAPFPTREAYVYDGKYMAGFSAERYSTDIKEGFSRARVYMENRIRRGIIARYHADVVGYLNVRTRYDAVTYKYLLLPVWMCDFAYKKKNYGFMVNGHSGKTWGKTPVSPLKVLLTVLISLGAVIGLGLLMSGGI